MVKISLKGFAKYMTANASQQRKILRNFKYIISRYCENVISTETYNTIMEI